MTMVLPSYAFYIFSAYLISAVTLAVTVAVIWVRWARAKKRLALLKDSETNL